MSWKFGPFTVAAGHIADVDAVNDNFKSVVEEVGAYLNEHNFSESGFTNRDLWAEDIGLRIHQIASEPEESAAPEHTVAARADWTPLGPGMSVEFTTKCRRVWVIASFQFKSSCEFGVLLALELDGVVLGETILGSGDIDNDKLDDVAFTGPGSGFAFGSTPTLFLSAGGPVVLSAVVELPPGRHKVRPVFSAPRAEANETVTIGDHEVLVVEMW